MPERIVVERIEEELPLPPPPPTSSTGPSLPLVSFRIINANTPVWIEGMTIYYYETEESEVQYVERLCTDYHDVDIFNLTGDSYTPNIRHRDGSALAIYGSLYGKLLHRRFLRIPNVSSDQCFFVSGDFPGVYDLEDFSDGIKRSFSFFLSFSSFSPDYDRYLKQAFVTVNAGITTDLSSIFLRDNFYSNIHGGIGILGTCSSCVQEWFRVSQCVETE